MLTRELLGKLGLASILLLQTACDPTRYRSVNATVSLPGSVAPIAKQNLDYPANDPWWSCPLEKFGTGAALARNPGFVVVGYEHYWDAGTQPFPCKSRLVWVMRARNTFDLSSIKAHAPRIFVRSALLSFDKRRALGDHDCRDELWTATSEAAQPGLGVPPTAEAKWDYLVPPLSTASCVSGRCSMEVRGQVDRWARGFDPDLGFVLRGEDERLDASDNNDCTTEYANFRLDLDYQYDVPESAVPPIPPSPAPITLSVTYVRTTATGEVVYDLSWNAASRGNMEIRRNGVVVGTSIDDGIERDRTTAGTVQYKVCVAGKPVCSDPVAVSH